ncbi:hypothetical protein FRC07_003912, partial [Ceratobasidium sp. 392]
DPVISALTITTPQLRKSYPMKIAEKVLPSDQDFASLILKRDTAEMGSEHRAR